MSWSFCFEVLENIAGLRVRVSFLSHVAKRPEGKTPRGPRCARQARQRLAIGRFLFTKPLGLNPNLIELNELKTRVSFFLELDNGKYCPWISLNFRNMTSSGDVIQIKNAIFKSIIIQLVFQRCLLSLRRNTPCLFDA